MSISDSSFKINPSRLAVFLKESAYIRDDVSPKALANGIQAMILDGGTLIAEKDAGVYSARETPRVWYIFTRALNRITEHLMGQQEELEVLLSTRKKFQFALEKMFICPHVCCQPGAERHIHTAGYLTCEDCDALFLSLAEWDHGHSDAFEDTTAGMERFLNKADVPVGLKALMERRLQFEMFVVIAHQLREADCPNPFFMVDLGGRTESDV